MRPTIRLGRVAGIEIGIHWSLLVVGAFLVASLASGLLPELEPDAGGSYWAAAILATALFFGSILAHELAHSVVAIRRGQRVEGITLWLFGGVARLRDEARDARSELLVALAGPATSAGLGAALIALGVGLDSALAAGSLLPSVAVYVGVANVVLAVFNLLPGAPLDGGRILAAVLWAWRKDRRRAQINAARAGRIVGSALIALGLVSVMTGRGFGDVWTALIGWFVIEASRSEELAARLARALDDHTIAQIMGPPPPRLAEWTTVAELRATTPPPLPPSIVLTGFGGSPSALLQTGVLRTIPEPDGAQLRLRELAIPIARVPAVPPDAGARAALEQGVPVTVVVDGDIVGVVGIDEIRRVAGEDAVKTAT
jgi:Zn-dependent protease